jgi:threonine dehydrogenase-like Zn-dependent dehydrogenase
MVQARQLVFRSDRRVVIEEFDLPGPGPGQVLVRHTHTQVSAGTEMNFFRLNPADGPLTRSTPGYMGTGVVLQAGAGVTGFVAGDRVVTCGNHCSHWLAEPADTGPFKWYIQRLDDRISDAAGGFVTLADVSLHGVRRAGLQIDESVAVFGLGIVGQLTVQLARLSGAHPIIAVDLSDRRLELALAGGATHTINAAREDVEAAVMAVTGGRGAETVFHCAPAAQALQTAMQAGGERAKIVLTASAPGLAEIGLQRELLRREQTILGVYQIGMQRDPTPYWPWTNLRNRQACLRLMAAGHLQVDPLITHVAPYTEAESMVQMMLSGTDAWLGVVFRWDA